MSDQNHWNSDFPIRQSAEHAVSRRQFVKVACCSAVAVCSGMALRDSLFHRRSATEAKWLAAAADIPVGGYKLFRYPTEHDPCILVRLSDTEFAAYSQACTHLMCPVHYQHEKRQFYCPCHEGFFSATDGRVLAGPPPRPLPRIKLDLRDGQLHALGYAEEPG